jgi:hypothetical protein
MADILQTVAISDPKAQFVADIVTAGSSNLKGTLAGHGISGKFGKLLGDRPDILSKLGTLAWTLKSRSKGIRALQKSKYFRLKLYTNQNDLLNLIDGDIDEFLRKSKVGAQTFSEGNEDNVIVYVILPLQANDFDYDSIPTAAKLSISANGASSVLNYSQATDTSYNVPGAVYLAAFVSDDAIYKESKIKKLGALNKKRAAIRGNKKMKADLTRGKIASRRWKIELGQAYAKQTDKMLRMVPGRRGSIQQLNKSIQNVKLHPSRVKEWLAQLSPIVQKYAKRALNARKAAEGNLGGAEYDALLKVAAAETAAVYKIATGEEKQIVKLLFRNLVPRELAIVKKFTGRKQQLAGLIAQQDAKLSDLYTTLSTMQENDPARRKVEKEVAKTTRNKALIQQRMRVYTNKKPSSLAATNAAYAIDEFISTAKAENKSDAQVVKELVNSINIYGDRIAATKNIIKRLKAGVTIKTAVQIENIETVGGDILAKVLKPLDVYTILNTAIATPDEISPLLIKAERALKNYAQRNGYDLTIFEKPEKSGDDSKYVDVKYIVFNSAFKLGWKVNKNSQLVYGGYTISISEIAWILGGVQSASLINKINMKSAAIFERTEKAKATRAANKLNAVTIAQQRQALKQLGF